MGDAIDRAQAIEARMRRQQIDRALANITSGPGPLFIDGLPCCRECEEPIASQRLQALSGVSLCIDCARVAGKPARKTL